MYCEFVVFVCSFKIMTSNVYTLSNLVTLAWHLIYNSKYIWIGNSSDRKLSVLFPTELLVWARQHMIIDISASLHMLDYKIHLPRYKCNKAFSEVVTSQMLKWNEWTAKEFRCNMSVNVVCLLWQDECQTSRWTEHLSSNDYPSSVGLTIYIIIWSEIFGLPSEAKHGGQWNPKLRQSQE